VFLRDNVPSAEMRGRMRNDLVTEVVYRNELRWLGHVLWKDDADGVENNEVDEVDDARARGRSKMTWYHRG